MKPFDGLLARACRDPRRIVLAEGQDPRVLEGAVRAAREGVAKITLLGREATICDLLDTRGPGDAPIAIVDPEASPERERLAQALHELRQHKGLDLAAARQLAASPLHHAALMVRLGLADGTIAGAVL